MTRLAPWMTALVLLLAVGLVHGLWTERWRPSDALEQAAARLEQVPLEIGDWQGKAVETDPQAFTQTGARSYWARLYTHRRDGTAVLAILMCGRSGKMAVHTPEVCYRGAGFDLLEPPARTVVRDEAGDDLGTFWGARFSKQTAATSDLQLYWGWGEGDGWQASANPRWQFRGRPFLYKLYASHEINSPGAADATTEFLRQLLPVLKETLPAPAD